MKPEIYKPGIYKTPGVYKGAGGLYNGRGVYNDGTGGGNTDIIYKTIFNNYNVSTGVDVPLIGENVTYTNLNSSVLETDIVNEGGTNFLHVKSKTGTNTTIPQTNIPVPTDFQNFSFELYAKFKMNSGGSGTPISSAHILQSAAFGAQPTYNSSKVVIFFSSSFNPITHNGTSYIASDFLGNKFYGVNNTSYSTLNKFKYEFKDGVVYFYVNDILSLTFDFNPVGKTYFIALSPRQYNELFAANITYKKI